MRVTQAENRMFNPFTTSLTQANSKPSKHLTAVSHLRKRSLSSKIPRHSTLNPKPIVAHIEKDFQEDDEDEDPRPLPPLQEVYAERERCALF